MNLDPNNKMVDGIKSADNHSGDKPKPQRIVSFFPKKKKRDFDRIGGKNKTKIWLKRAGWILVAIILLGGVIFSAQALRIKNRLSDTVVSGINHFAAAITALRDLRFDDAGKDLASGEKEVSSITRELEPLGSILNLNSPFDFLPVLNEIGRAYKNVRGISVSVLNILGGVEELHLVWPKLVVGESGDRAITALESIRSGVHGIMDASGGIIETNQKFKGMIPGDMGSYLGAQVDLARARDFLDAFVPWISSESGKRVIVLLGNPSELRPGGGFSGSYAEVLVQKGSISKIEVRDISYADREFSQKIVPPEQLQALVTNWRAADANWFFEFPMSAKKTIDFIEASEIYKKDNIKFDALVFLSDRPIRDILDFVGEVKLQDGLTITSENFISEIQKDVQKEHDVGSQRAKDILSEIAPAILSRISNFVPADGDSLFALIPEWTSKKDLLVYVKDPTLNRFAEMFNITGSLLPLPAEWSGDYLAVVNSNIGGGKTDLAIKQKIRLELQIGTDGILNNHLVITRKHSAKETDPWWYAMKNKNFAKVYTPPGTQLTFAEGAIEKKIKPSKKYETENYSIDPDIKAIEDTKIIPILYPSITNYSEFGRNVFSLWTEVTRGRTSEVTIDYSRRLPGNPREGQVFTFIFDKQASARGEYSFEFTAPIGFRFKENGLPVFEYNTDDPDGHLELTLTLENLR